MKLKVLIFIAGTVLALVLASCGGGSDSKSGSAVTAEPVQTESAASESPGGIKPVGKLQGPEPKVETPPRPFPKKLVINDLRRGSGTTARADGKVTIQFSAVHFDGHPLESSWEFGQPFRFTLGSGELSPGWEKGIPGMKVGGRRELMIPWDKVFPSGPAGGDTPNDGIVYVIDLLEAS